MFVHSSSSQLSSSQSGSFRHSLGLHSSRGSRSFLGSQSSLASLSRRNLASESSRFTKPDAQVKSLSLTSLVVQLAIGRFWMRMERMSLHNLCWGLSSSSESVPLASHLQGFPSLSQKNQQQDILERANSMLTSHSLLHVSLLLLFPSRQSLSSTRDPTPVEEAFLNLSLRNDILYYFVAGNNHEIIFMHHLCAHALKFLLQNDVIRSVMEGGSTVESSMSTSLSNLEQPAEESLRPGG